MRRGFCSATSRCGWPFEPGPGDGALIAALARGALPFAAGSAPAAKSPTTGVLPVVPELAPALHATFKEMAKTHARSGQDKE